MHYNRNAHVHILRAMHKHIEYIGNKVDQFFSISPFRMRMSALVDFVPTKVMDIFAHIVSIDVLTISIAQR